MFYYSFSQIGFTFGKVSSVEKIIRKDSVSILYRVDENKKTSTYTFSLVENEPVLNSWKCSWKCSSRFENTKFFSHIEELLRDVLYENNLSLMFIRII